jgi:predicted HTH domain antitoxin
MVGYTHRKEHAMSKVSIEIEVPERIRGTDLEEKLLEKAHKHALEQAVVELYQEGSISTGTGAELMGMPLYDFIQFLGQHQVSIFNHTAEELAQDVQAAKSAHEEVREN